jgi:hypothetical protein
MPIRGLTCEEVGVVEFEQGVTNSKQVSFGVGREDEGRAVREENNESSSIPPLRSNHYSTESIATSSSAQGHNQHSHNQYQSPLFPYLTTTPIDGERNNMMNCPSHAQPDLTSSEQHPSTNYTIPAPSYYNYYQYPNHNHNSIRYHHPVHYHQPWQHYSFCNLSSEGGRLQEFYAPPSNTYDANPLNVDGGYSHVFPDGHLEHRLSSFSVSSLLVEERQDVKEQEHDQSPQVEDRVKGKEDDGKRNN